MTFDNWHPHPPSEHPPGRELREIQQASLEQLIDMANDRINYDPQALFERMLPQLKDCVQRLITITQPTQLALLNNQDAYLVARGLGTLLTQPAFLPYREQVVEEVCKPVFEYRALAIHWLTSVQFVFISPATAIPALRQLIVQKVAEWFTDETTQPISQSRRDGLEQTIDWIAEETTTISANSIYGHLAVLRANVTAAKSALDMNDDIRGEYLTQLELAKNAERVAEEKIGILVVAMEIKGKTEWVRSVLAKEDSSSFLNGLVRGIKLKHRAPELVARHLLNTRNGYKSYIVEEVLDVMIQDIMLSDTVKAEALRGLVHLIQTRLRGDLNIVEYVLAIFSVAKDSRSSIRREALNTLTILTEAPAAAKSFTEFSLRTQPLEAILFMVRTGELARWCKAAVSLLETQGVQKLTTPEQENLLAALRQLRENTRRTAMIINEHLQRAKGLSPDQDAQTNVHRVLVSILRDYVSRNSTLTRSSLVRACSQLPTAVINGTITSQPLTDVDQTAKKVINYENMPAVSRGNSNDIDSSRSPYISGRTPADIRPAPTDTNTNPPQPEAGEPE